MSRENEREGNYLSNDDQILEDNNKDEEESRMNRRAFGESAIGDENVSRSPQDTAVKTTAVKVEKLQSMMRSKHDMCAYCMLCVGFKLDLQILTLVGVNLPDYHRCPIQFMQGIMSGNKKVSPKLTACI